MTTTSQWPNCSIESRSGVPTFVREGKPWFAWGINRPILGDHFEAFERMCGVAGLRHIQCEATCSEDIYHPELRFWHGPEKYDGAAQDQYFSKLAKICPEALFHLRLYVGAPDWWLDAHPGECQVYHDGANARDVQNGGVRRLPSVASELWREESCRALHHYVRWLVDSGWSRRVFAILVCYGITWEWGLLGSDGYLDYSVPMQNYFRAWLRQKYTTTEVLSAAWGRPVRFEDAVIPSAERRGWPGGEMGIRPVPQFQDVIDFQQVLSEANADLLLALAAMVKEASSRRVLVGAFYGYTLTARDQSPYMGYVGAGGFHGGHHAFGRALRSPDIDYFASPYNYADRSLGTGLLFEHVPLASIHAHGKAFLDENDLLTHTGHKDDHLIHKNISFGKASNWDETLAYLRMGFAQAIVRGKHQWFAELAGWLGAFKENYSDPAFLAEVRRLNERADELLLRDRSPVTELAFVLDEKSIGHLTLDHKGFLRNVYQASISWGHTGAPFDLVLLDDLLENRCGPYRLVVPACLKTEESIGRMKAWLEQSGTRGWWDGKVDWYPGDISTLMQKMEEASVHRYVEDGSTAWANASMVLVHVNEAGERTIRFRQPCRGTEFFSGRSFDALSKECRWEFGKYETALFLLE